MKKRLSVLVAVFFVLGGLIGPALAEKSKTIKGQNGQAGKSNTAHLYLFEKDVDWNVVKGGAWGKMKYNLSGPVFEFVFNGHSLVPGEEYQLLYYPDPWPGQGLICLGAGIADENGDVHIKGADPEVPDMPIKGDQNFDDGAKIWLVLITDVDCSGHEMIGWNPASYLFEWDLIEFENTMLEPVFPAAFPVAP